MLYSSNEYLNFDRTPVALRSPSLKDGFMIWLQYERSNNSIKIEY